MSAAEIKRPRIKLGEHQDLIIPSDLIQMQLKSYAEFLQQDIPLGDRTLNGLHGAFSSIFPIKSSSGNIVLEYHGYQIGEPVFDVQDCLLRGLTYSASLQVKLRLVVYDKDAAEASVVKDIKEQTVYMGEIPLMTQSGDFTINGSKRVVVSQLHRSPGVFFEHDKGKTHSSGKLLYSSRIIPYRGAWLDAEFDVKNLLYVRIDRRRKLPVTVLLRALGCSSAEILDLFYDRDEVDFVGYSETPVEVEATTAKSKADALEAKLSKYTIRIHITPERMKGMLAPLDILDQDGKQIIKFNRRISKRHINLMKRSKITTLDVPATYLLDKVCARAVVDTDTGEEILPINALIDLESLNKLIEMKVANVSLLSINDMDRGAYISDTMRADYTTSEPEALVEIYRVMRPGEPPTPEASRTLFDNLFFNADRYDLSRVGRMKFNRRLGISDDHDSLVLNREDIIKVIQTLVDIRNGIGMVDDIDNLANRRVRCVGEMVENQFRAGLERTKRAVLDRFSYPDAESFAPQEVFNAKPVVAALHEFFGSSQMSQFMDATNPLSALATKRRVTALGPGGLTRDRAGYEVRDVHHTHYGRICPIETPEGPNIGLINSLSIYSRINDYGFIETPFRKVDSGKLTNDIEYLSAIDEDKYHIGECIAKTDDKNHLVDESIKCRYMRDFTAVSSEKIDYLDVSPRQIVSVAASLIPFLEHNDANRALMGSNMQRQAVPLVKSDKPLVGTGMERVVASDSGVSTVAKRDGVVELIDAEQVIIRANVVEKGSNPVDVYPLIKFSRSNNNTCVDQRPIVRRGDVVKAGDIIADGSSTDLGELSLGQ
ncbi:MAG: DNA-directed RNA polymerase subunit beta, partial [Pseudomonadota bacterium]|nr:DNA-directed RNA polymerase subunit beta [Pseudomonadota bacterium]